MENRLLMWGLIIVLYPVLLVFIYALTRRLLGAAVAKRQLRIIIPFLFGIIALTLISYETVALVWPGSGWIFIQLFALLALWSANVVYWRRRRQAGDLLFKLGRTRHDTLLIGAGVAVICFNLLAGIGHVFQADLTAENALSALLQLSLGVSLIVQGATGTEIREKGIWHVNLIPWTRITGYQWERDRRNVLTLQIKSKLPLGQPSFTVPPTEQNRLASLLERHLSAPANSAGA